MDPSRFQLRCLKPRRRLGIGVLAAVVLGLPFFAPAQTHVTNPAPTLVTNLYSGPHSERLNIVVFGDGYTSNHLDAFQADVSNLVINTLFKIEPYANYRSYFNVFSIPTASLEEGADIPASNVWHDTYFNCTYGTYGIDRLLTAQDLTAINELLAQFIPEYSTVIMLVNDSKYGGSGGSSVPGGLAVIAARESVYQYEYTVRHELGHGLGSLKDEYDTATPGYSPYEAVNCTAETNRDLIKWRVWIKDATPLPTSEVSSNDALAGIFEGCMYTTTNWYRPHYDSLMNGSSRNIGQINADQLIKTFYNRTPDAIDPFNSYSPADTNLTVDGVTPLRFSVAPMIPSLHALSIQWYLDGALLAGCTESNLLLSSFDLGNGSHVISNVVFDPTPMVRIYTNSSFPVDPLTKSAAWNVTIANQPASNSMGELEFSARTYAADKAGGAITISVTRSHSSTGAVSVAYATTDGTAVAGLDYLDVGGTLAFPNGTFTNQIAVPLLNDAAAGSNKTFGISLSNPAGGAWLGAYSNATVTIQDFNSAVILTQNFDSSIFLPDGWSHEFVEGTIAWYVHTNYGLNSSHCARIWHSETSDHKTKLITPPLNFGSRTNNAVLSFWMLMPGNFDQYYEELRIFYRTGATNSWILAAEYTYTNVYAWTWIAQSVPLPEVNSNYYVAFEGNSHYGWGLRLDDIAITASVSTVSNDTNAPSQPLNLALATRSSNAFSATWSAATDNVAVVLYYLYLNEAYAGYTTNCAIAYAGLQPGTVYSTWIVARDLAGNLSPPSATLVVTTSPDAAYSPPGITANPQSVSVTSGASAAFSVSVTGSSPLCYFWQKDAVPLSDSSRISGAGDATLTIAPVESADAGNYSVVATNMAGAVTSATAVLTVAPTIPSAPTGISASKGAFTDRVRISWNTVTNASAYEVYRNTAFDSASATKLEPDASSPQFDDTTVVVGTTYYYWVKAKNATGVSDFSSSDSGYADAAVNPPAVPVGVAATKGAYTDRIRVCWSNVAAAMAYEVYRNATDDSATASRLSPDASSPLFDDTTADIGTTYYYHIKAKNAAGTSAFSAGDYGFRASPFAAADFDGDRRADPALYQTGNGWYVWFSSMGYAPAGPFLATTNAGLAVPGDFDGDHMADPALYVGTAGWTVYFSDAGYAAGGPYLAISLTAYAMAGDVDGDGCADPALYLPGNGWYIWFSGAGYAMDGPFLISMDGVTPLLADFDADHKADPALYRQAEGWYIWFSGSGYTLGGPFLMGIAGFTPTVADFDGDHKADPGLYQPATGYLYLWLSASGYALVGPLGPYLAW